MGSKAEKTFGAFEAKVKRTVYLDNLSPHVTDSVIKSSLDQYGTVTKTQFIPNYTEPNVIACPELVELENTKQAANVVEMLNGYPFMMLGTPRPVRARPAQAGMLEDRPVEPSQKIKLYWLHPGDQDFEVAKKPKKMATKHQMEDAYLLKRQLEDEEKLSKTQDETLERFYKVHESMKVLSDRSLELLERDYERPHDNQKVVHNMKSNAKTKKR